MRERTLGQIAFEAVYGHELWPYLEREVADEWEKLARAVADRCLYVAIEHGADEECIKALDALK